MLRGGGGGGILYGNISASRVVGSKCVSFPKVTSGSLLTIKQVLAFQKSWRSFSPIIVCILAQCLLLF